MSKQVTIVDHPLVAHKLTILRNRSTSVPEFRELMREIGWCLGYEAMRDLELADKIIQTPVSPMTGKKLAGRKMALVTILRAGDGLLRPMMELVPDARVGHIGMSRNEETLEPEAWFFRMPLDIDQRPVVVVDPMLATGGSAIAAINLLKENGVKNMRFICLVAAPEGVEAFTKAHPDIPITTASVDEKLNENGYIVPGLGDAGDRIFGTEGA